MAAAKRILCIDVGGTGLKAAVISPLSNLYPVISVPVAVFWFHERIGAREWIAIATALLSVVALSWETPAAPNPEIVRQPAEEAEQV